MPADDYILNALSDLQRRLDLSEVEHRRRMERLEQSVQEAAAQATTAAVEAKQANDWLKKLNGRMATAESELSKLWGWVKSQEQSVAMRSETLLTKRAGRTLMTIVGVAFTSGAGVLAFLDRVL